MPRISVVTSLYCVGPYVDEFHARSCEALKKIPGDHEFVFVDDGSPDDARDRAIALISKDARVRVIELSRNFGQHRALWIGLQQARGELVFLVDADLEEDPGLVAQFYAKMQEAHGEADVVYGVMEERKGGAIERIGGALFYSLINRLSDMPLPRNVMNARLMTRAYVDALLKFGDAEPFLGGLMILTGFRQIAVACAKESKGTSAYTFRRKLRLALDALFALSTKPMTWILWAGVWIAAAGLAGVFGVLRGGGGATALALASVWLMGGLVLMAVGTVGAYVGRVLTQTRGRPTAIVRRIHDAGPR